jgi:hypothetical protein
VTFAPLPLDGPTLLRIAADALSGPTDYADDHIWEIVPGGEPAALAVSTSFGRRAVAMRIYPSFGLGGPVVADPAAFARSATLEAILPSYLRLRFSPLTGLEARSEVRVQDSHTLAGRVTLTNTTDRFRPVRLGLHGQLSPAAGGQGMLPRAFSGVTTLAGKSGGLEPVLFLTGGAIDDPGLSPALVVRVDLAPGASRSFHWAQSALPDAEKSFEQARTAVGRAWDAEVARLERIHGLWVEVQSGNAEWDAAFHFAQQSALNAFVGPGPLSSQTWPVLQRAPERGFSPSGDGRDYADGWDGVSVLDAYLVLRQMVWAAPETAAGVLRNFWETQAADGSIDARPGPAGQRARLLCSPLLATVALRVHEVLHDEAFLEEAFRALWPFFRRWTAPHHDRDGDGWPEWDHPGHPPWPVHWGEEDPDSWIEASFIEDPALAALLYREASSLEEIALRIGRGETAQDLAGRRRQLRAIVQRAWSEERCSFRRIERDSHRTPRGSRVARGEGPGKARGLGTLRQAGRVVARVATREGQMLPARLRVRGRMESGRVRVETVPASRFHWMWGRGTATTELAFASIESVEVQGIPGDTAWEVRTFDLEREDLTLLLPLWAQMVEPEQAEKIIKKTLLAPGRYLRPGGLSSVPADDSGYAAAASDPREGVNLSLNLLLAEGLVGYGYRAEAADLLGRLMTGALATLRSEHAFPEAYQPDAAGGLGKRHHLGGLPPLSLFLDVLGVSLQTPNRVLLQGTSPFESRVVIRWRGLMVERTRSEARVEFADGRGAVVRDDEKVIVEQVEEGATAET